MQGGRIQVVHRQSLTHAVFRLSTKRSLISSYRTWLSWQKCSISTSDSTLHCHLPSWPSLKCLQSEKDSKSLKERASLAAHAEVSPRFPRLPSTDSPFPSDSSDLRSPGSEEPLSPLKSRVTASSWFTRLAVYIICEPEKIIRGRSESYVQYCSKLSSKKNLPMQHLQKVVLIYFTSKKQPSKTALENHWREV